MLSTEENERLTKVGLGTPMGTLFRRFWLPAILSSELPEPGGAPIRIRLLGEDLVAFRDGKRNVGILQAVCPHRGAPLFFGRTEIDGLRCVYHGIKFDTSGICIDTPNEPAESRLKSKISAGSYKTNEVGDVIWVYMGPEEFTPEVPRFEWTLVPPENRSVTKWVQETNWMQGHEGEIDSSHVSFLHGTVKESRTGPDRTNRREFIQHDRHPVLIAKETAYGLISAARRTTPEGSFYWRLTQALDPMYSLVPTVNWPVAGRAWVPIDDETTFTICYRYYPDRALPEEVHESIESGSSFPPRLKHGQYRLRDGQYIDTWYPEQRRDSDYGLDREMQRSSNYSGIYGTNTQDRAVQEGMGYIMDRSAERLGMSDISILRYRRRYLRLLRALEDGTPPSAAGNGDWYKVRPIDVVLDEEDLENLLRKVGPDLGGDFAISSNSNGENIEEQ